MNKLHSESFRAHYLFLGLYLEIKNNFKTRYLDSNKKERDKSYLFAFERLVSFLKEKINTEKEEKRDKVSINQFENAFNSFCDNYYNLLKSPYVNLKSELPDYFIKCCYVGGMKPSEYIKRFEEMVISHPNPFTDQNFVEFLQLLKINYQITGNEELKKYIIKQLKKMLFPRSILRKPKKTEKNRKNYDDYYSLRWPRKLIFLDQIAYIWTLEYLKDNNNHKNDKDPTIDMLTFEYATEMSDSGEQAFFESHYNVFRREIFPVYYWFAKFYFQDKIKGKTLNDKIECEKILLYTMNRNISQIVLIFGNYTKSENKINEEIINKFGLDNNKGLGLGNIKTWGFVNSIPQFDLNNNS